jgi:hypothetical protein
LRWRLLKLDFPYLIGELVIVVLGVVIALAANGLFEDWREKQLEGRYLHRIAQDMDTGYGSLREFQEKNRLSRSATAKLMDVLDRDGADLVDKDALLENFLYAAKTGGTISQMRHDVTFNELVSAGRFNVITDPDLRMAVTNYYRLVEDLYEVKAAGPSELLFLFFSLTGFIPEEFTMRDRGFSDQEKARVLQELQENRELVKILRTQHAFQGLFEVMAARVLDLNRDLFDKLTR